MKKIILPLLLACQLLPLQAQTITESDRQRAAGLVSQMTLEEKIDYIGGYNEFYIRAIPRLGIPEIRMADGPQGVRNETQSTMFPCGIAAAATWNRDLIYDYGRGLGQDARARGVRIMLGPGVNIYRSPLCGRNFEYFGEDPYLASETAVSYIKGMQSEGVMATVKHFAGNNQEWDRHHASSDIDERTLHEIYLPAFRKAVQEAHVGAVMSSYNPVNCRHMTENKELTVDVLRDRWGFEGIFMSDWNATYSAVGAANGGLDLEMPCAIFMTRENLVPALRNGVVSERVIDLKCRHILQTLSAFGFLDTARDNDGVSLRNEFSDEVALNVARESIVLLKNEDKLLPLRKARSVVVTGPNAGSIPTGGGSGFVNPFFTVSVAEGISSGDPGMKIDVIHSDVHDKENESIIRRADAVIYCAGFNSDTEGEYADRTYELPGDQSEEINSVSAMNPNLIVIVNSGGSVRFSSFEDAAKVILMSWYPGQEGGHALADILLGKISPSGRLPITIERRLEDSPSYGSYYENVNRSHRAGTHQKRITYMEGIFCGYRGYDRMDIEPRFPFGYGLSYSDFEYSDLKIRRTGKESCKVTLKVRNRGGCDAFETVQLYVGDMECSVLRPERELKGYKKVFLEKGQECRIELELGREAFAFYDVNTHDFIVEPGQFSIEVGSSSRDIRLRGQLVLR